MEVVLLGELQEEINSSLSQSKDYNKCTVSLNATGNTWGVSNIHISTNDLSGVNTILLEMAVNKYVKDKFGKRIIKEPIKA